jgi:hypothetical protein
MEESKQEQWSIGVSDHRAFGELHRLVICPIQRSSTNAYVPPLVFYVRSGPLRATIARTTFKNRVLRERPLHQTRSKSILERFFFRVLFPFALLGTSVGALLRPFGFPIQSTAAIIRKRSAQ